MSETQGRLASCRVLAALNGLELFGHERGNIEVFKILREQGAEVIVGVNTRPDNHVKVELHRLGFDTFDLPFGPQWSIQWVRKEPMIALTNVLAVLRSSWHFHRAIRTFRPSHVHLGSPLAYSYVALALGASRVPLVYRMGDCPPTDSPFNLRIWRMAMRRTAHVVSNSEFVRESALRAGARNISIIYNLAPSRIFRNTDEEVKKHDNLNKSIVYVGAISKEKGLFELIEAFSQLVLDDPLLQLDILGGSRWDTSFRSQLIELISLKKVEGSVRLHGHLDDPSRFYRCAAIHVAPSLWEEPLANVVMEAKREGTPSIVFPSGGLPEMIRHQIDGYVCREKSVDALVEGLRWMLADDERLARMGKSARHDFDTRFGRERFAREWASVYRTTGMNDSTT